MTTGERGTDPAPRATGPLTLLLTLIAGAAVGLIGGCFLGLVACGIVSISHPQRVLAFWTAFAWGLGAGIGTALGFTALNWLVGYLDQTKTRIGQ
jgi:hypothetical protein